VRAILRVISGLSKGHKLKTVNGLNTRPTTDRVKESVFSVIAPYIEDACVLDLFAGTGSLGIEALSRGAKEAVFVDHHKECIDVIQQNIKHTKFEDKSTVIFDDVYRAMVKLAQNGMRFDMFFLDPPYSNGYLPRIISQLEVCDLLKKDSIIVAECFKEDAYPDSVSNIKVRKIKEYGETLVVFYA